jgi:translation initiation factor IF-3
MQLRHFKYGIQLYLPIYTFPLTSHSLTHRHIITMRTHTTSSMRALYRVFVQPALSTRTRPIIQTLNPPTTRAFSITPLRAAAGKRLPEKRKHMWDEEIPARRIQIVDPETDSLQPPVRLRDILSTLDRKGFRIVCVTQPPTGDWTEEWIPVCKIEDKKAAYEAEKEKKKVKQQKMAAEGTKTLELNWAIDANDLGHRMKRMQDFLGQGKKVEIILARKKGGRRATPDECEELLQKINEAAETVKGTKEVKKFEGKLAGMGNLMYEGPKP